MEKTTLLNNGKIINHIGHFGRTQIQKCLLLLLRHILALNWVCLALSMVHFLWEKHCSSDFFLLLFLLYFMCGNCTTYRCIDNRIEWKCFSISFRCFPFSFFFHFSLTFLSFTSLFFSFLFIPKSNQNTYICSQSGCWHWSDGSIEIDTQYVRISCLPYRMYISYKKRSKSSGVVIVMAGHERGCMTSKNN